MCVNNIDLRSCDFAVFFYSFTRGVVFMFLGEKKNHKYFFEDTGICRNFATSQPTPTALTTNKKKNDEETTASMVGSGDCSRLTSISSSTTTRTTSSPCCNLQTATLRTSPTTCFSPISIAVVAHNMTAVIT